MTEQDYWNKTMAEIRRNNRVLLNRQDNKTFIPVVDESTISEFVFIQQGSRKVMAVF